ncbi:hypothetical protein HanRHA438_Chr07g0322311 [Helianthus annuus]|nr:hypothetical protein HanRHA438_Chr07g0322311 [Helianthus annuus]
MFFKIKIITGTTGLLTAPDSVQGGSGVVTLCPIVFFFFFEIYPKYHLKILNTT